MTIVCTAGFLFPDLLSPILSFATIIVPFLVNGIRDGLKVRINDVFYHKSYRMINCIGRQLPQLSRKHISDMYYTGELESEMRMCPDRLQWCFYKEEDREKHLETVMSERMYCHTPADGCAKRG